MVWQLMNTLIGKTTWYLNNFSSKSCEMIYRFRNTLDIKSRRLIYYSLVRPYLTDCVNVWLSTYRTNFKMFYAAHMRSVRVPFATAQQPHSGIFSWVKIFSLWINRLINKKEYLPIKWSILRTCLATFSLTDMTYIITNLETMKI